MKSNGTSVLNMFNSSPVRCCFRLKFTESQLAMFLARNAELERDANDKSTRCEQLERRLADVLGGSSNSLSIDMDERETAVLMPDSLVRMQMCLMKGIVVINLAFLAGKLS